MTDPKTLGLIGLGNMGQPMSKALMEAGYVMYGADVSDKAEAAFEKSGGLIGLSQQAMAKKADVMLTSLPSPEIVEAVYLGDDGIIKHAHKNALLVDLSTVSPQVNEKIAKAAGEAGLGYVGAPVSGGVIGAEKQTLTVMAGGEKRFYDEAYPIFDVIGGNVFHVGESPGAGTIVKLINNLYIGFYTQAVSEALTMADQAGIDHKTLYDILKVSYGRSGIYERNYESFIAEDNYQPGFTIKLLLKDLGLGQQMANENDVYLPIMEQLIPMYQKAVDEGYAENDMASMYLMVKDQVQKQAKQEH